jgi:membrane protein implicated in regulation of membrane protease activity
MRNKGFWMLAIAGGVFAVFLTNVVVGAAGGSVYLTDVTEMLTLFLACVLFVVAVLWRESSVRSDRDSKEKPPSEGGEQA